MPVARLTDKQEAAMTMFSGPATHLMLYGGSRSGKTFLFVRAVLIRAAAAPDSRHCILRFRFNHVKASIIQDTLPKVLKLCFPDMTTKLDKTDWILTLPNGSQVWFGGLDDKERTEKILGQEFATIYLNECSQIPYSSRNMAVTRLAQQVDCPLTGEPLRLKMLYDCNPPGKGHWSYQVFVRGIDPDTKKELNREDYAHAQMNPLDNQQNLPPKYIEILKGLPPRQRVRFLEGAFADDASGALWSVEKIEEHRALSALPDMQRIVVAVDPSGSRDTDNMHNDAIGIIVAGLGVDGNGYLLEDLTLKTSPAVWGRVAATAYDRHAADAVVGEENFGGAMVEHVIQTARPNTPYRAVKATRNKVVRAEPVAALAETGRIRHAGFFSDLEDELTMFTTAGYLGENSPNRADAYVWAFTELFGDIVVGQQQHIRSRHAAPDWRAC